ncbi:MAG: response regulator [Candidatus Binatia bacterium]
MRPISVLLADDHGLVRDGLRALLDRLADVRVVAEASDGREALQLVGTVQPDVVLMDIGMPGMNGLEATQRAAREFPHVRVIILSMHASEEYVLQALHAGAAGYLLKDTRAPELEMAIKSVARGDVYLTPSVSKHVVADYLRRFSASPAGEPADGPYEVLTARQREVVQLVAEGHSTKEIAGALGLSAKTVETYRADIMARLDIHDIAGLVRYAIRTGLISSES